MSSLSPEITSIFTGPVFTPGDPGYAPEITGMNLAPRRTPELVVGATGAGDIAHAVRYARERGLSVSVIGGGHGAASIATGLTITTRRMDGVRIDPEQRTATFDAGVLWKPVMEAASAHGLLPIAGSLSAVGAAGYLLGGGTSPLARSHGYSSDYVESMTVVTGAGEIVTASSSSNPELFWALRGGKSGLGIVTEITLRLVELRQVYGGALTFSEDQMDEAFRGWIDWTRTADDRVTTSFATISFPDMDGMPPPFRGKRISFLRFAYPGDPERGAELAVPLRALAPALHDDIGPLPTDQLDRIHNDPTTPLSAWEVGGQLRVLDDAFADVWLAHFGAGKQPPLQVFELRHGGAAQHQAPSGGDAVANRAAHFTMNTICIAPDLFAEVAPAYARNLLDAIGVWTLPVANVNFIGNNPFATPWDSATLAKLDAVRTSVDPNGIFASAIR
ncbi:MAG TPA: FAD-binding oxidoreductase [Thermomicrobiales bacterium]|nr:FAD-binding oxidoreductase [Thermomicrobiales bacterium]